MDRTLTAAAASQRDTGMPKTPRRRDTGSNSGSVTIACPSWQRLTIPVLRDGDRAADVAVPASGVVLGERKAIGRAISMVESREVAARSLLRTLEPHLGHALVVGVTGAPGAGNSTLVGMLISQLLQPRVAVGALLVDPSSPRTKGAILGD